MEKRLKTKSFKRLIASVLIAILLGSAQLALFPIGSSYIQTNDIYRYLSSKKSSLSDETLFDLSKLIVQESRKQNLDPKLVVAVIAVESTFKHKARSQAGAIGLMQIRPFVGRAVAEEIGIKWEGTKTLYDPVTNIKIGIYYFAKLQDRFDNDINASLAAYNYGPTYISKFIRLGKELPNFYSNKVLAAYDELV